MWTAYLSWTLFACIYTSSDLALDDQLYLATTFTTPFMQRCIAQTKDSRSVSSAFSNSFTRIGADGLANALCRLAGIQSQPRPQKTSKMSEVGHTSRLQLDWGTTRTDLDVSEGGSHYITDIVSLEQMCAGDFWLTGSSRVSRLLLR